MIEQINDTAMPSMVRDLIEDSERKYTNSADASAYEEIAKNVAGIAYAGELGQSCAYEHHC